MVIQATYNKTKKRFIEPHKATLEYNSPSNV